MRKKLLEIYDKLFEYFGPRDWWPAETSLELMTGAVLNQAVAWRKIKKFAPEYQGGFFVAILAMVIAMSPSRIGENNTMARSLGFQGVANDK